MQEDAKMAREREGCYETTTKLAWSDRHDDVTAMLTGSEYEQEVHDEAVETSVVISRDLRHAIDLLRAVPSACITSRRRSRLPLRPVNRLSLPPQLPHHRDVVPEDLAVRQCSSMTDDVMYTTDTAKTTALQATTYSDRSSDASTYVLPWKIRRVKKHKLNRVLVNAAPSSWSQSRHHRHPAPSSAAAPDDDRHRGAGRLASSDSCTNSDEDEDDGRQSASSESLDSIVERILENAASDTERHRSAKRLKSAGDRYTTSSNKEKHSQQHDDIMSAINSQQQQPRTQKTLEDLFEEAVESLRDDVEYLNESAASPITHRRLRSAENWEKQIYDTELHDQCRHYRLQTYNSRDVSHVNRGFALVQKLDKKHATDLDANRNNVQQRTVNTEQPRSKWTSSRSGSQCRDDTAADVAYLQRIVISAKAASSDSRHASSAVEDGVDLGLEMELAANQRQRTSRSSSSTWDTVSVDSLVMYDDDEATVHAATLYSSAACSAERRQLNNEFINKLRRLQEKWQQSQTDSSVNDDNIDKVGIPTSLVNNEHQQLEDISQDTATHDVQSTNVGDADSVMSDKHQPETDTRMTSLEDADSATILSDCVTSQHVVIKIKLPRLSKWRPRRPPSSCAPTVPFRELRLRREIRFSDDVDTSAVVNGAVVTSSRDNVDVANDRKSKVDDVDKAMATVDQDGVMLTADSLFSADDLSTLFVDADVEYDNKDTSRSVELVPTCDSLGRCTSQQVDVSRSEATRVVRLSSTSSSQLVYSTPSLIQTVDNIRRALLNGVPGARADGVAVCCEAEETVSRRGDQSAPVVRNIVVDCLPPHHSLDDNSDNDDDSGNRTSVTF